MTGDIRPFAFLIAEYINLNWLETLHFLSEANQFFSICLLILVHYTVNLVKDKILGISWQAFEATDFDFFLFEISRRAIVNLTSATLRLFPIWIVFEQTRQFFFLLCRYEILEKVKPSE